MSTSKLQSIASEIHTSVTRDRRTLMELFRAVISCTPKEKVDVSPEWGSMHDKQYVGLVMCDMKRVVYWKLLVGRMTTSANHRELAGGGKE